MKKTWMITALAAVLMTGCSIAPSVQSSNGSSVSAVSAETDSEWEEYTALPKENAFEEIAKEDLKDFLSHGTGILYFSFPECPWCQVYMPMLNEVLMSENASAKYYNIYTEKKEDRTFYDEVASLVEEINDTGEEIIHYDNDGKQVIYMPLVLFIENGRITAFNNETSMTSSDEITPSDYWTAEKVSLLQDQLKGYVMRNLEAQAANDVGCDEGCSYGS